MFFNINKIKYVSGYTLKRSPINYCAYSYLISVKLKLTLIIYSRVFFKVPILITLIIRIWSMWYHFLMYRSCGLIGVKTS